MMPNMQPKLQVYMLCGRSSVSQTAYKQKQYYNIAVMDLKAHQKALQNIRSKYSQGSTTLRERTNPPDAVTFVAKPSNDLFKTPTKLAKKEEGIIGKIRVIEKPHVQAQYPVPPKAQRVPPAATESVQALLNKKLVLAKDKGRDFEEILAERDKQLTERVERNKQLLSKSKEVRERESRNGSVETGKGGKEGQAELNQLKLVLKDKNYVINDKSTNQKKSTGIGLHSAKDENIYTSIKKNFTDKMKQNLAQNFGTAKPKELKINQERQKRWQFSKDAQNSCQDMGKFQKKKQKSHIKTPIPPPKESSPSKITSIFSNTQKIEERIHALLSR